MKKIYLVFTLIFLLLVSSACASADLNYSLTEDNKTNIQYKLAFDQTDQDLSPYLNEIGSYWAQQGMSIYVDKDDSSVMGEKTLEAETVKEAAENFAGIFALPDSIFSNVSFTYAPSLSVDDYSFSADVSLMDVIRQNQAQSIPADQISKLEDTAKQGTYQISISLPGDVIESNADSQDGGVCTWTLDFGKIKSLSIHTQKQNAETVQNYNKLTGIMDDNNMLIIIFAAAAGFCVLMIVLSIVVRNIKRKHASEIRVKHFR